MKRHLNALNKCRDNMEMIKYCTRYFKKLGRGSSRTVYRISTNKVIKIAHNQIGVQQNEAEIRAYEYISYDRERDLVFFAKVFTNLCHSKDLFIIQEYCDDLSTAESKEYIEYYRTIENKRAKRFHAALRDLDDTLYYKTLVDLNKGNIGRSVRGAIKIRDYGLSEHIAKQYRVAYKECRHLKNMQKVLA